nr:septum formation family protein [Microbacterium barkeri]
MVPFAELQVGDCLPLVEYDAEDQIYDLPVVPCEQPHTDEIYYIFQVEGESEFPGDDPLYEIAWDGCIAQFEAFVGVPYESSVLDVYSYQPTRSSWARADDRTVHCIVFSYEDVTGTLRGAGY